MCFIRDVSRNEDLKQKVFLLKSQDGLLIGWWFLRPKSTNGSFGRICCHKKNLNFFLNFQKKESYIYTPN